MAQHAGYPLRRRMTALSTLARDNSDEIRQHFTMAADNSPSALERLQAWYHSNCDGDWEHQYGFRLETLDNPGWHITVDLDDTDQQNQEFIGMSMKGDGQLDWIDLKRDGSKLRGACGPTQLGAMLEIVTGWLRPRSS